MSLVRLQLVLVGRTAEVRLRYYPVVSAQWDERVKKTLALALCTSITRRFRSSISLSFAAIWSRKGSSSYSWSWSSLTPSPWRCAWRPWWWWWWWWSPWRCAWRSPPEAPHSAGCSANPAFCCSPQPAGKPTIEKLWFNVTAFKKTKAWWLWFCIEIVIMILKPLPSSFWAPQQAPEALEPRLQNWLKSIDKCLHIYSWKTSKASINISIKLLCCKGWAKTCYFDRVPVQELPPAQQAGENGIKITLKLMFKLNWKAKKLFKTTP